MDYVSYHLSLVVINHTPGYMVYLCFPLVIRFPRELRNIEFSRACTDCERKIELHFQRCMH